MLERDTSSGVWRWRHRLPNGDYVHQASDPTPDTPNWCPRHLWAYDAVCLGCTAGLIPFRRDKDVKRFRNAIAAMPCLQRKGKKPGPKPGRKRRAA